MPAPLSPPKGAGKAGTVSVTQEEYESIVLTHLEEIWGGYGKPCAAQHGSANVVVG